LGAKDWETPSPFWDAADVNDHAPKLWWDGDKTIIHFAESRAFADVLFRTLHGQRRDVEQGQGLHPSGRDQQQPHPHPRRRARYLDRQSFHRHQPRQRPDLETKTEPGAATKWMCAPVAAAHASLASMRRIVQLADGRLMAIGSLR